MYLHQNFHIIRWKHRLKLHHAHHVFNQLYAQIDGCRLSHQARGKQQALEYVYGEIDFASFIALLSLAKPSPNTIFYDLGSGTGKAVIACAMVFKVRECHGIELFPLLHQTACKQKVALKLLSDYQPACNNIYFSNADFFISNISTSTMIYINATGFLGSTWLAISDRITAATQCTTVITTSKALKSKAFIVVKKTAVQMSWGVVNAYIQKRIKID